MLTRRHFLVLSAVAVTIRPAYAAEIDVPMRSPLATVALPDDWKAVPIRRGIETRSPDGEVFLWLETYKPNEYNEIQREHESYFRRQGLKLDREPKRSAYKRNDMQVRSTIFDATWRGKANVLIYLVHELGTAMGDQLLLTYWASQEGHAKYDADMKSIVESIKPKSAT